MHTITPRYQEHGKERLFLKMLLSPIKLLILVITHISSNVCKIFCQIVLANEQTWNR